jgi:hypothetical protein
MRFEDRRKAAIVIGGSVLVTAALVALALSLGSWAFQTRRFLSHERRLNKALQERPSAADLSRALREEGNVELVVPQVEADLRALVARSSPGQVDEVIAKRRAAREVRAFGVTGMIYFLFFDAEGRLQGYVLSPSGPRER